MERKRQEMQDNARERDDERRSNVSRYREEDERERNEMQKRVASAADFVK